MDQILAKASNQAVTFAIRSGISIASGYAIKTITKFLDKLPESEKRRIEKSRNRLQTKIDVVSVSIDLVKLAAARGNTILESTLNMIQELASDIEQFQDTIDNITEELTRSNQKDSVKVVLDQMKSLEDQINDIVPLLNLSLITAGVNMSGSIGSAISPGRLLQASNYLAKANDLISVNIVGPTFDLVMYSIFYNPSRMKYIDGYDELSCITWKETYARSSVKIAKVKDHEFRYTFEVHEDFNDGRYHDDDEKHGSKVYDVKNIERLFFSASGNLLKLDGRNSPVLIIKLVDETKEEWIALGELNAGEFDSDEEEEEKEPAQQDPKNTSLSLLEYILRLAKLQEMEEESVLNIKDEVLSLYLQDEAKSELPIVPKSNKEKIIEAEKISVKERALGLDSNISRLKSLELS